MPSINILSPHTADLIAAGEVVERPASVVKELIENSIDAGAKNISIEVSRGGMDFIRVSDDGCGMSPEDAGIAFLRHATSKIKDAASLEAIATLGFRGEALAAVSAVSKIELITREHGAEIGTLVALTAGEIDGMSPTGCREGTSITIKALFYNTPARLKFLKSDRAEGAACLAAALRCALGHPEISMRMTRDGQELFFTPGDGEIKSALYSLLGRELAMDMLEAKSTGDGIKATGFVSAPHACRGNRSMQFFFINGRSFKSALLQAALENAYKNSLLVGRFPACAIYISLDFSKVDVNVHPTKQEVKFSEEKKVFDAVYYAALSALMGEAKSAEIALSPGTQGTIAQSTSFYKPAQAEPDKAPAAPYENLTLRQSAAAYAPSRMVEILMPEIFPAPKAAPLPQSHAAQNPEPPAVQSPPAPQAEAAAPSPREPFEQTPWRVIGEALATYIIVESGDTLALIDKHAAHERVIFDRLMAQQGEIMSQPLLIPETFTPAEDISRTLEEHSDELRRCGYDFDIYGTGAVVIRALPADTDGTGVAALEEIAEKLKNGSSGDLRDEILHTIACKAAIKAGKSSQPDEIAKIAEAVMDGSVRYCPHGRPVSVSLTKRELDKQFMRIV